MVLSQRKSSFLSLVLSSSQASVLPELSPLNLPVFFFQQTNKTHTSLHFTVSKRDKWSARFFSGWNTFAHYNDVLKLVKFNIIHFPELKKFPLKYLLCQASLFPTYRLIFDI
jgi:hypothetical protein